MRALMISARRLPLALVTLTAFSTYQCAEPATEPETAIPVALEIVGGDGQSGTVGTELPEPLAVRALDEKDKPLEGALVNFVVTEGGGHLFAGSCLTNKEGECRERWTLGTKAGEQAAEARAVDPTTGAKIVYATFTALALPGPVAALETVSGDGQSAEAGTELPDPLVVRAVDQYGNAIPEVEVNWSVTSGGGSVDPEVVFTGEAGEASGSWTLGLELGEQTAKASAGESADAVFTATANPPAAPTWVGGLADLPTPVRAAAGASNASRIYVLGGNAPTGYTTINQIYDPATDTWRRGADFNAPARDYPQAAAMSDGIHLLGGAPGTLADHQVYDPATDTWSFRAPLPDARNAAVVEVVGDKLYVPGGGSDTGPTGWLLIYDLPTDSWSTGATMPTPRAEAASAMIAGKIYVAGGRLPSGGVTDALEVYDPATDSWTVLAPMPAPRQTLGGGNIGGKFCVFGGREGPDTFCYDPVTDMWSQESDMITPRFDMASAEYGGRVYAIGGSLAGSIIGVVERLK